MQVFLNQPWRQMCALLIGKDAASFAFLHYVICGSMFFYELEGHMQKLCSFGRVKNIWSKRSLRLDMQAPLQLFSTSSAVVPRSIMKSLFINEIHIVF